MAVAVHLKLLVPHAKKGNRGGPDSICKRKEVAGTAHSTWLFANTAPLKI